MYCRDGEMTAVRRGAVEPQVRVRLEEMEMRGDADRDGGGVHDFDGDHILRGDAAA
jgi:hypothetical protein